MKRLHHTLTLEAFHWARQVILLILCAGIFPYSSSMAQVKLDSLLRAYYPFTNSAGDSSGNGFHGNLRGGASANGILTIGNNATDYVNLPANVLNNAGDFTIATEIRFQTIHNSGGNPINIFLSGAYSIVYNELTLGYHFRQRNWTFFYENVDRKFAGTPPAANQWFHYTLTREGSLFTWFIDGYPIRQMNVNNNNIDIDTGGLIIGQEQDALGGSFDATQSLAGNLDNLRFYRRALNGAEIDSLNPYQKKDDVTISFDNVSTFGAVAQGTSDVQVRLCNQSTPELDSVRIQWQVNGILQTPILWKG